MLKWLWVAAVVIAVDQLTKAVALSSLVLYVPRELFPGFNWTLSYNQGAAFSFLADAGGWQRWMFTGLALLVSAFILRWMWRLMPGETQVAVGLSMILGGALGNAWDRLYLGHVVDFIDVYYPGTRCVPGFGQVITNLGPQCHWPAFNIADSAIFIGAALLIIDSFRAKPHKLSK